MSNQIVFRWHRMSVNQQEIQLLRRWHWMRFIETHPIKWLNIYGERASILLLICSRNRKVVCVWRTVEDTFVFVQTKRATTTTLFWFFASLFFLLQSNQIKIFIFQWDSENNISSKQWRLYYREVCIAKYSKLKLVNTCVFTISVSFHSVARNDILQQTAEWQCGRVNGHRSVGLAFPLRIQSRVHITTILAHLVVRW